MTHFSLVHDFATEPAAFWRIFFHEPYNVELYQRLQTKERTMISRKEDDHTISWVLRVVPARDLPGWLKKIVGGDLGYTEISTYYKGQDKIDVTVEPTIFKDRTRIKALYTITPLGPGKCRRKFEGDIKIDMPLVGGKVEGTILDDMRRSYELAAKVTEEWIARGGVPA